MLKMIKLGVKPWTPRTNCLVVNMLLASMAHINPTLNYNLVFSSIVQHLIVEFYKYLN